jgi:hypothetical protein
VASRWLPARGFGLALPAARFGSDLASERAALGGERFSIAERPDADAFVVEPVDAGPDRITGRLPEQILVRRSEGRKLQRGRQRA